MNRLSPERRPMGADPCLYDRAASGTGIVHFGLGAFTRAHQAWYTHRAMLRSGGDWMIAGVSLRSPDVAAQLNPQGGLYTLAQTSEQGSVLSIIDSVGEVIVGPRDPQRVIALLAAPSTHVVTFTVTEKGYCRNAEGTLDTSLADDTSIYRYLREGLGRRKAAGAAGLTLLSCDNLADNGRQLKRLLLDDLRRHDADLAAWTEMHCSFPNSMVDRIVPATTQADRDAIAAHLGLRDEGAVMTEPFSQWVIEDDFAGPRPAWDLVGAQIVPDVTPFEMAKLRMLNGAHSALAYCGLRAGYGFVHEAAGDPELRSLAERLMRDEAAPTIEAAPGQDLMAYADALMRRFDNPALNHRLIQIAMDGSQKIPQRWLATLAANQRAGRACPALLTAIDGWIAHIRGDNIARWGKVDDPRADDLAAAWAQAGPEGIMTALFGREGLMSSEWVPT